MAQEQKLAVSALNVRIVQRENRDYEALFRSILRQRNAVRVYSNDYLILTSFGNSPTEGLPLFGALGRFTDIPEDAEWLDTEALKEADEDSKAEISIPDNLKPNYKAFYCGLFPKQHLFVFESFSDSESLSPRHVLKWAREATLSKRCLERFGPIEVDLVPDYEVLERILKSDTLRSIEIVIKKPNPDDYTAAQFAAAEERLARLRAREERTEYKAEEDKFLDLDDHVEALARVGAENGRVAARLQENGAMKDVSTDSKPLQEQDMYDPDYTSPVVKFASLARRVLARVATNRG